jgi:hypothetical protein
MDVAGRVSFAAQGSSVPTDTKLDFTLAPFNALFLSTPFSQRAQPHMTRHGTTRHDTHEQLAN